MPAQVSTGQQILRTGSRQAWMHVEERLTAEVPRKRVPSGARARGPALPRLRTSGPLMRVPPGHVSRLARGAGRLIQRPAADNAGLGQLGVLAYVSADQQALPTEPAT